MSGIVTKGLIGKEDHSIQESGYPTDFSRVNSSGGASDLTKFPNLWKYFYKAHTVRYYGSAINSTTINAALNALTTERCILVIPKEDTNWSVNANIAFPSTMRVLFEEGAVLAQTASFTVTFGSQPIIQPDQQVFSGFSSGQITGLTDPWGEWWGAKGDHTTDSYNAIACAIGSIASQGIVSLGSGVFLSSDTLTLDGRYRKRITLKGQGSRNTWLLHTGSQSTGALIIKGGGYSNSLPVYGNTGADVKDIALGSLGGPALTLLNATRCFDTHSIHFFSAKSTAEYLLISGDSGMNHIENITDVGNDINTPDLDGISLDYPLYGIRFEKGTGTYGPMENKIVRPRIEYTRDAALQVDLSYEENIFESVKFGSGRISGPAINIVNGPIKLTGMNYLEKYGSGTVGINLDNKTGAPSLVAENVEMGAQSIDLGTYGDAGTELVSLDIRGSNFLDIRNSVPSYIDVLNVINCRTLNMTYLSDTLAASIAGTPNVTEQAVAAVTVVTAGTYLIVGRVSGNNSAPGTKSIFKAYLKTGNATYGSATQRAIVGAYAADQNRVTAVVFWIGALSAGNTIHLGGAAGTDGGTANIVGDNDEANATELIAVKIA